MQEIITLHCGIENCNIHFEYHHSDDPVIAISAEWRNEESKGGDRGGLLPAPPKEGHTYELTLNFPLKIDLAQPFRATYFEPATQYNGLESEAGINSLLFCLCKKTRIVEINRRTARMEVEVVRVQNVTSDNNLATNACKRAPDIEKDINTGNADVEDIGKFRLVKASFQGDLGWMYVIEKKNGTGRIVAENQWDAHRDTWQMLNEEL